MDKLQVCNFSRKYEIIESFECIVLRNDVALLNAVKRIGDNVLDSKTIFIHPDKINELQNIDNINFEQAPEYRRLALMKKDFLQAYQKTGFPMPEYSNLSTYYIPKEVAFNELKSGAMNPEDILYITRNSYNETYFMFVYGDMSDASDESGWIPHFVKYNGLVYNVTNKNYDLESLAEYLFEKEKEGEVLIDRKGMFSDSIIKVIPYYNRSEDEDMFINFLVKIDDRKDVPRFLSSVKFFEKKIEKFKK